MDNNFEWRTIIENLQDTVARFDRDLRFTYVNRAYCTLNGRIPEEVLGRTNFELDGNGGCTQEWTDLLKRVLTTGQPEEIGSWCYYGGREDYVMTRVMPEVDENGKVNSLIAIGKDLTEQKNAERELAEQTRFITQITTMAPDIISVLELPSRKLIYSNESLETNGFAPEDLKKMAAEEQANLIHPEDRAALTDYFDSFTASTSDEDVHTLEYRATNKNSEELTFRARGKVFERTPNGAPSSILNLIQNVTTQKEAEHEILALKNEIARRTEDKYRVLFESVVEGYCLIKLIYNKRHELIDWIYLEANATFKRQNGYNPVGKKASEVNSRPEDFWLSYYGNVASSGKSSRTEHKVAATERWYSVHASPVEPDTLAVVFNDITERKRREEQQKFILKLSDALHHLSDPAKIEDTACCLLGEHLKADRVYFAAIDEKGGCAKVEREYLHRSARSMKGVHPLTAYGLSLESLRRNRPVVVGNIHRSRIPHEEHSAIEALQLVAFISIPLVKSGVLAGALTVGDSKPREWKPQDIEAVRETMERTWAAALRVRAEEAQRESDNLIARELECLNTLQGASTELISDGNDDIYARIQEAAIKLMHSDMASMQMLIPGKNELYLLAHKGFHPDSARHWMFVSANETTSCGRALATGHRVIIPDIEKCGFEVNDADLHAFRLSGIAAMQSTPLISRSGKHVGMISTHWKKVHHPSERELNFLDVLARQAADLIERKHAEQVLRENELQLKQLIRLKDEFISIASHELKTPVTSMKVYAEIVKERLDETGNTYESELLTRLNIQIDKLNLLINDMLDTTRVAEGRLKLIFEPTDINALLKSRIENIWRTGDHIFQLDAQKLHPVTADKERLGQVITNFLSNAIKYSPKKTTISVTASDTGSGIRVGVRDQGYGISEDDQKRIFERFFRVTSNNMDTFPGMGLGLYISSQIIQRHGGAINVWSRPGEGSEFSFTIPYTGD